MVVLDETDWRGCALSSIGPVGDLKRFDSDMHKEFSNPVHKPGAKSAGPVAE